MHELVEVCSAPLRNGFVHRRHSMNYHPVGGIYGKVHEEPVVCQTSIRIEILSQAVRKVYDVVAVRNLVERVCIAPGSRIDGHPGECVE